MTVKYAIIGAGGTGAKMQEKLPGLLVTDGCIYVSANTKGPGVLIQHGKILRVVYGVRKKEELTGYCRKISGEMLWKNSLMYRLSVQQGSISVLQQRIFRERERNGKLLPPCREMSWMVRLPRSMDWYMKWCAWVKNITYPCLCMRKLQRN